MPPLRVRKMVLEQGHTNTLTEPGDHDRTKLGGSLACKVKVLTGALHKVHHPLIHEG